VNRAEVATRLIDTYLQQIFVDGFFHADPHPGNLFVNPLDSKGDWQLTFVDFGMVGRVPKDLQEGLREMLIGVGTQDPERVIRSYQLLGVLLPSADLELLAQAEEKIFTRFWGKTMNELREIDPREIREIAHEFRDLLFTLPFQVPQDLIFLGRAVGILSGLCTGLDPDFNIFEHLVPYARRMIAEEARPAAESLLGELATLARSLVSVPRKMDTLLTRLERGEIAVRAPEVSRKVDQLDGALRQIAKAIVFMALLIGGIQLYLGGSLLFAEILLAACGLSFIWLVFTRR
jgi:predicted unusual protein kinase regulating ubiquinone biosynthesis (AarF/ABC1/UbiB family)